MSSMRGCFLRRAVAVVLVALLLDSIGRVSGWMRTGNSAVYCSSRFVHSSTRNKGVLGMSSISPPTREATAIASRRFSNTARVFRPSDEMETLRRLDNAHVCVVGLGGVGSWAVEALARSGIGRITLIDADEICESNINRQIAATSETIGRFKAHVLQERVAAINPHARVHCILDFARSHNVHSLLQSNVSAPLDYVIDAIDNVFDKASLLDACSTLALPVVTSGGVGGLSDPSLLTTSDLVDVTGDSLLREVRTVLRQEFHFPKLFQSNDPNRPSRSLSSEWSPSSSTAATTVGSFTGSIKRKKWRILAVHSLPTSEHWISSTVDDERQCGVLKGRQSWKQCDNGLGSHVAVSGAMGLLISGIVINRIATDSAMIPKLRGRARGIHSTSHSEEPEKGCQCGHWSTSSMWSSSNEPHSAQNSSVSAIPQLAPSSSHHPLRSGNNHNNSIDSDLSMNDVIEHVYSALDLSSKITAPLFDAHNHLQLSPLFERCAESLHLTDRFGIQRMSVCGTSPLDNDWDRVVRIHQMNPERVIPSFGLHPWWISRLKGEAAGAAAAGAAAAGGSDDALTNGQDEICQGDDALCSPLAWWAVELEKRLLECPQAGVGECGLDKLILKSNSGSRKSSRETPQVTSIDAGLDSSPRKDTIVSMDEQLSIFRIHMLLAHRHSRVLTVHCVQCWGQLAHSLQAYEAAHASTACFPSIVLHSCNGMSPEMIPLFLRLKSPVYFSLAAGGQTFASKTVPLARAIPRDRLLIETDAPDQLSAAIAGMIPHTGPTQSTMRVHNDPSLLKVLCLRLAEELQLEPNELANLTFENAQRAFSVSRS